MSAVAALVALLVALAVLLAGWALWPSLDPTRRGTLANLRRGQRLPAAAAGAVPESRDGALTRLARRVTPELVVRVLDRRHMLAGRPAEWPMDRLLTLKLAWVPAAVLINLLVLPGAASPLLALVCVIATAVVYLLPELLLHSTGQKRNEEIEISLADTLDQMMIAVEAGLAFDAAMARAAHNGKGALAEELTRTLQDIQLGRSRRQAFEALAARTAVADLRRFVRAVVQADSYGVSIADVLRTQAAEMRRKRRQRAEEKAQKIPVKVLPPLMLCILPVLFIVVMGPAAINMIAAFGGM